MATSVDVPKYLHAAQHAAGGPDPITPASIGAIPSSALATLPIFVQWDKTAHAWPNYDHDPTRVRVFLSQDDVTATAPTWYNPKDKWEGQGTA